MRKKKKKPAYNAGEWTYESGIIFHVNDQRKPAYNAGAIDGDRAGGAARSARPE